MLNRRLLVYTSGGGSGPASLVITVIDYDTKQPVANAMVSLYDEFNAFIANLGFTDNSGVIMFADFTLSPGGYWFQAGAADYMINRVSYTVLSEAPINDEIEIAIQKPLIPPRLISLLRTRKPAQASPMLMYICVTVITKCLCNWVLQTAAAF